MDYINFRKNTPELFQAYEGAIFKTSYKGEETFKNLSLYFGFQKNFNLNKVQPYLGLDVIYTLTFYKCEFYF